MPDPQTQVSMRLIETETGRITATVNETFGASVPVSVLSERLSRELLAKLEGIYPVRGEKSEMEKDEHRTSNVQHRTFE